MTYLVPATLVREAVERVALSALPHAPVLQDEDRGPRRLSRSRLSLWILVRDELRGRRQKRARLRALKSDLASYTTRAEVDDLLGSIEGQEGAEADLIRSVLDSNHQQQETTHRLAS